MEHGWSFLHHLPYSPDFASADLYFSGRCKERFDGGGGGGRETLSNENYIEEFVGNLFTSTYEELYSKVIEYDKSQQVIANNGEYTIE